MKKFLSILLAVMMVLSTVSFAAPSLSGTADSAVEAAPEVLAPVEEVAAELSAEVDKASFGTLIYKVDFENANFDLTTFTTAYGKASATASYINPDFDCGNLTTYTNVAGDGFKNVELVTEDDNTFVKGDVNAGYSGFFRMTKYNCAWPEGYYTFVVDVKAPAGQVSTFAQQCNDTAVAIKTTSAFDATYGDWQTVVNQTTNVVNGADIYGYFVTPNNATAGTVSYDNWEVYYRPATVTLTIAGEEYEVSTDAPVSVASLASKVKAPTGYVLSGLSLTEGGELLTGAQYFFEDTTLYPVFEKDTTIHDVYGKPLYIVDFEREDMQGWYGSTQEVDNSVDGNGAQMWAVASKFDERFDHKNYRIRFVSNEKPWTDQKTYVDGEGNHYTMGTITTQWPQLVNVNWGNVMGQPGIYTYSVDTMTDTLPADTANGSYTKIDGFDGKVNVWDKIVVQYTATEEHLIANLGSTIFNYSFTAADKGVAKVAWDNAILYYKPLTADVTLIANGEEYVAENISTSGVSADSIVAAAGVEIPYGKKAVLSATFGGESVGNVINLVMDSTYYVSFVADDSISEYGKRLFLVDFENFNAGDIAPDTKPLAQSTSNFNGDWGHLTINYEAGTNTIVEEEGNKILKGQQGWAQIRINNANFASAPEGIYTMALKVKNYGTEDKYLSSKDQAGGDSATWVKAGDVTGTSGNYFVVLGEWNEVAAELPKPTQDFTIYHTNKMTTDVGFDDIALYYRPASVNLTLVDVYGDETVYEDVASTVNVDDLLADVSAPFGYKAALSAEKNGEPLTGTINLVSDAKLYVVLTPDETVSMEYGKALFIIDLEREDALGWDGNSQTLDNSVGGNGVQVFESASYYDPRFQGNNYRVRFVINESGANLIDQKIVADENGNHYVTGTNTTKWPQVCSTNWGNVQGEAGVYTFMFDVKVEASTESSLAMGTSAFNGGAVTEIDGFFAKAGEWDTVVIQSTMDAAGAIPKGTWGNFNFAATGTTTLSFDNAKLYFKPINASVKLVANGAVVATKTAATAGVLVSELVSGVKVDGYEVTGVKLGTDVYGLDETVKVPCDCQLELALEKLDEPAATPHNGDTIDIRVDTPVGVRYKASFKATEDSTITDFGFLVTRASFLPVNGEGKPDGTALQFGASFKYVEGYGRFEGEQLKNFLDSSDDDNHWFAAVLYFSEPEADGLPAVDRLVDKLVARPFVKVGGTVIYGNPTEAKSFFDVAWPLYNNEGVESLEPYCVKVYDAYSEIHPEWFE